VKDQLEELIVQELSSLDLDLVELRRGGMASQPLLEIRVDRRDGGPVTIEDCARVSRALNDPLEQSGLVSSNCVLQVSSPGDRPLRSAADWRRFVGRWATVLSPDSGGRFEGKIMGLDEEAGVEVAVLKPEKGNEKRIPLATIKEARLAFHL
jgi:ribosome maturation factor RimP